MQFLPIGVGTFTIVSAVVILSIYSWSIKNGVSKACYSGYHHGKNFIYPFIMTSFTHYNALHLIINMLALAQIGYMLERKIGAAYLILLFLVQTVIVNVLLTLFYLAFSAGCVVGASGVIFALLAFWCYSTSSTNLLFWCFPIRTVFFPWLILVLVQIIFWRAAFWGHVIGILTGIATYYVCKQMHWISRDNEDYIMNENNNVEASNTVKL